MDVSTDYIQVSSGVRYNKLVCRYYDGDDMNVHRPGITPGSYYSAD